MARSFVSASSEGGDAGSAVVSGGWGFTMVGRVNISDETQRGCIMCISDSGSSGGTGQAAVIISDGEEGSGGDEGNLISAMTRNGGGSAPINNATHATGLSAGTWYQFVAVFAANDSHTIYLDGAGGVEDDQNSLLGTMDETSIGYLSDSTPNFYLDGDIADLAIYDYAMTAAEAALFSGRLNPLSYRPDQLLMFVPCYGNSAAPRDLIGGLTFTMSGSAKAAHPPSTRPKRAQVLQFPTPSTGDALLAEDVEANSELSIPAIDQVHVLAADDVESNTEVDQPALTQVHDLLADDVESNTEVSAPTLSEVNTLLAEGVEANSEVSIPALAELHVLAAEDVESDTELSIPAVGQVHTLAAADVESNTEVTAPTLSIDGEDALLAEDIESLSEVSAPSVGQVHVLLAEDLESLSSVSRPRLDYVPPSGSRPGMRLGSGMMGGMGAH